MRKQRLRNRRSLSAADRKLGLNADISRRDFLNGAAIAIGASCLPSNAAVAGIGAQDVPGYNPPEITGMRGSHPGSFETAHAVRDGQRFEGTETDEQYDLVVVGGGISGLAAAYYFRESYGKNARILILDNHDDFGGHAKRNEFQVGDRQIIGYGGTMLIEAPAGYPEIAKQLLAGLGIETDRFYRYFDQDLYESLGLKGGIFFDKDTFGADYLAVGDLADPATLAGAPLSERARSDLSRLYSDQINYLEAVPPDRRRTLLSSISYQSYLRDHAGMNDEVLAVMLAVARNVWAVNIDAYPAFAAWSGGYPGFGDLELGVESYAREGDQEEPYIFHFPDGNATIARLLVRSLVPAAAPGDDMEDIVTARFDYSQLDRPDHKVRIRLGSTVVRARHTNDDLSKPVAVTYVREGKAQLVHGTKVVMACYNAMIPMLCEELPESQKAALGNCVRAPLVYSNVLIRNWNSFVKLGIDSAYCPGEYHHDVTLDFPVSIGDYRCTRSPDEPIVLHLTRVPGEPGNPSARGQFVAGKRDLYTASFEDFERNIRDHLNRLLGPGGFDSARDIAAITVNRWPHGYAYGYDPNTDRIAFEPGLWPSDKRYWEIGSRRFGNISIAGTDAASNAMTESAIVEAYRAVGELD
jgi:spermidine dehydrogenase